MIEPVGWAQVECIELNFLFPLMGKARFHSRASFVLAVQRFPFPTPPSDGPEHLPLNWVEELEKQAALAWRAS